jgi:hypothetical protein
VQLAFEIFAICTIAYAFGQVAAHVTAWLQDR